MSVPYCVKCRIEMRCIKTGYILRPLDRADNAHYHTDLFKCKFCDTKATNTLVGPCHNNTGPCKKGICDE